MTPHSKCCYPVRPIRWATDPQQANSGGPASRRRTERVLATVMRDGPRGILLPGVIRAGLDFGADDPLDTVLGLLAREGLDDAEQLRKRFSPPTSQLIVRIVPNAPWAVRSTDGPASSVLEQALLLGLCTSWQYDPGRPVLWTRASLTRRVELHDPRGFYA